MWDPFSDFEDMRGEMGKLLERAATPTAAPGTWIPMVEEDEEENAYVVRAELRGIPAENMDIEVGGQRTTDQRRADRGTAPASTPT
ncbi:hypothetical protein [Streptomyces sp. NPDC053431]|uniref:hypothetical protein n=1 Tax=Streptomyces sp. NPDC053431 TaxID=3365703 RepID=UPI0037D2D980